MKINRALAAAAVAAALAIPAFVSEVSAQPGPMQPGYGMGPGMMGPGAGYGMGPGMMGPGYGYGMMGPGMMGGMGRGRWPGRRR